MTTLADAVNATAILLNVDGSVPAHVTAGFEFQLDDEILRVVSFGRYVPDGRNREPLDDRGAWYVDRGLHGTTAAAHDAGTAVKAIVNALIASEDVALPDPLASAGGTTLSADIVAGLEGAATPSGENPFATMADVGGDTPTLAAVLAAGANPNFQAIVGANGGAAAEGSSAGIRSGGGNGYGSGGGLSADGGGADGSGGQTLVEGGAGASAKAGGNLLLRGGFGNDGGADGASMTLQGGDGAGNPGAIILTGVIVAASDPHVENALWADSGANYVIKLSQPA